MKKADPHNSDMREEYDFSDGVRGKYAARFAEGSNVVVLDPDVASEFRTRKAVNTLSALSSRTDVVPPPIRGRNHDQQSEP
jgi:hypothetical protein